MCSVHVGKRPKYVANIGFENSAQAAEWIVLNVCTCHSSLVKLAGLVALDQEVAVCFQVMQRVSE